MGSKEHFVHSVEFLHRDPHPLNYPTPEGLAIGDGSVFADKVFGHVPVPHILSTKVALIVTRGCFGIIR